MKKNPRRGGPVSKMVMGALVLATTAGFVSGLTRNASPTQGDSSVWGFVQRFFAGPYANRESTARSDEVATQRTQAVTRYYSPNASERFQSHPLLESREITLLEPVVQNTTGVNANGTATFDANLFNVAAANTFTGISSSKSSTPQAAA